MKKIIIIVDTEEDNQKIEYYFKEFLKDNFQKEAKIIIEDVI